MTQLTRQLLYENALESNLYRNAIINGNFDIWQRGGSFTTSGYWADRWRGDVGGGATISRQSFTPGQTDVPNNPRYFLRYQRTSAGSIESVFLEQRIENPYLFSGKTVTLSFWAKADAAKSIYVDFYAKMNGAVVLDSSNTTINLTTSWQKYTVTMDLSNFANGATIAKDDYLSIRFVEPSPFTTFTFDIAQVQLNKGSIALPYLLRSYTEELMLCRRFTIVIWGQDGGAYTRIANGLFNSTSRLNAVFYTYPFEMRKTEPTISYNDITAFRIDHGNTYASVTNITGGTDAHYGAIILNVDNSSAPFTAGEVGSVKISGSSNYLKLDAEL